jgi:hypothetical protein
MEMAGKLLLGVALNYGVHYVSMTAHNMLCIPHSLVDLLKGLVVTASPVCSTLVTIGQTTQNAYGVVVSTAVATAVLTGVKTLTS